MTIVIDADKAWIRDLEHVLKYGDKVSPRGMLVAEVVCLTSVVSMSNPIIFNAHRKLGYKFMAAEAAWILSGDDKVESIAPYSKDISKFSDDGVSFFGAYGPKVKDQVPFVVSTLHQDPDSRQAVINIWRESPPKSKDIPCTLSLQFLIRNHVLHCVATMRSSDLWLGHPYDIFNFSAISFLVMLHLNKVRVENGDPILILGNLHLTAGSKHLYERNWKDVHMIIDDFEQNGLNAMNHVERTPCFLSERYSHLYPESFVDHLWECADSKGGAFSLMFGSA